MTRTLPVFRSDLQAELLALVLLNRDRAWTAPELAKRLGASSVAVHRELHQALRDGTIARDPVGRSYLYRAETDSPLFEPLQLLLERTAGVRPLLTKALTDTPGVEAAFLHGSLADGSRVGPLSDVDVLVIGAPDPHLLRRRVDDVEQRIGREIDVTAYTRDEFAKLAKSGNSFAKKLVKGPIEALVGSPSDLPGRP